MANAENARWVALLLVCLLGTTACGSAARRSAGATVMGLGGVTGLVSLRMMVGGCSDRDDAWNDKSQPRGCKERLEPDPTSGAAVLTVGLTTLVAGAILYASGLPKAPLKP